MLERFRKRQGEEGFTLIELLVVVIILGVLSAVVVFAVRGTGDKGQSAALQTDADTVRTAEEAFCAKTGSYGTMNQLTGLDGVDPKNPASEKFKFLSEPSELSAVAPTGGGPCGTSLDKSGFVVGYAKPNGGSPASFDVIKTSAYDDNFGTPTPFAALRGPGNTMTHYMFDPLLWRDQTGKPMPWLAAKVPVQTKVGDPACNATTGADCISPDGKVWKLTLRTGVKWQDSTTAAPHLLTPADVKFTYDYRKTNTANKVSNYSVALDVNNPNGVIYTIGGPAPLPINTFINTLQSSVIIPQHIWSTVPTGKDDYKLFGTSGQPTTGWTGPSKDKAFIGTGAYKLGSTYANSYPTDGQVKFTSNPDFFLGQPYVRNLEFWTVTDSIAALKTGVVNAGGVGSEEGVPADSLTALSDFGKVTGPGGWNRVLQFNPSKGFPFDSIAFRQSVAYAIDRNFLLQSIVGGRGKVSSSGTLAPSHPYLAPGLPTYDLGSRPANVAKAKQLLDSIGLTDPDGDGPLFRPVPGGQIKLYTSDGFVDDPVNSVVGWLKAVGVDSVRETESNTMAPTSDDRAIRGEYSMMFVGWGNVTSDPDQLRTRLDKTYTDVLTDSTCVPGGSIKCYKNGSFQSIHGWNPVTTVPSGKTYAQLAASQLGQTDPVARKAQVREMQQIVAAEVPELSLYVPDSTIFYPQGGFSAWYLTPGGTPPGPPGFNNKLVLVTGTQFGLPPTPCAQGTASC